MGHSTAGRRRRLGGGLAAAGTAAILGLSATASAGSGYIVTMAPSDTMTCQQTITAVTTDHSIKPTYTYTSSSCGFFADMSAPRAGRVAADPRVQAVTPDAPVTAG